MLDGDHLAESLAAALGERPAALRIESAGGGDIHRALRVRLGDTDWFVKWNRADALPLLETEFRGLLALAEPDCIDLPRPLTTGSDGEHAWLAMRFEALAPTGDSGALGRRLARLHRATGPAHGWDEDNFIGHSPQENGRLNDWAAFWWRRRLRPQLRLAAANGHGDALAGMDGPLEAVCFERLDHAPPPSLLHGDLWGGNHGYRPDGTPLVFDPAPWHGDRETDLAMMRLFGGFGSAVFRAYEETWPVPAGHERRLPLYQLYHVLNHLNLFGAGWLPRVKSLVGELLGSTPRP